MAIFINETGRSFPNVDDGGEYKKTWQRPSNGDYESHAHHSGPGTNYRITFNDDGPGTAVFASDRVYYIGDNDEQCFDPDGTGIELDECDYTRQPIYRWYRGGKDHKYTPRQTLRWPTDFTGEQTGPTSGGVKKSYNAEPRNGSPVFFCARTAKPGKTKALHHWYENDKNDTWLVANNNEYNPASSSGGPGSGYVYIEIIGYVFNTLADAQEYADTNETAVPLYEYYKSSSTSQRDHFYTANPAGEVNLERGVSGVPDCKDPRDEEYDYVGIVGYVFTQDSGSGNRRVYEDKGLIGPIGYSSPVDYATRSGWYDWEEPDLAGHYSNGGTTAAVYVHENYEAQFDAGNGGLKLYDAYGQAIWSPTTFRQNRYSGSYAASYKGSNGKPDFRWGHPDYCPLLNRDAYFEWIYGKNGGVKGAVPKYLEFHTAFDSQFVYYVYNTTYPWKGPIFSVQYSISDRNQCPNRSIGTGDEYDDQCVCDEQYVTKEYHSHFYEIRPDSWKTTNTSLTLTNFADGDVENCFKTVDTESTTILFRYITGGLDRYQQGDTINGWEIGEHGYFGNKLRCGYMELTGRGRKFTAGQIFTPKGKDAAQIEIIAGFGVKDRAGFFGVYEFPKQLSYYKVEIDKTALVHSKTLDQAEVSCTVNERGRIQSVRIDNAGFGYKKPQIVIQDPVILNEYAAMDMTREVVSQMEYEVPRFRSPTNKLENYDGEDYNFNFKRIKKNTKSTLKKDFKKNMQERQEDYPYAKNSKIKIEGMDQDEEKTVLAVIKASEKELKTSSSEDRRKQNMKAAELEISKIDGNGSILEITIKNRGRGYDPDPNNPPRIFVVELEEEEYRMRGPNTKKAQEVYKDTVSPKSNDFSISGGDINDKGRVESAKAKRKTLKDVVRQQSDLKKSQLSVLDDGTIGSMQTMMNGFNAKYPTGYIKVGQVDEIEQTQLCSPIPASCVKIRMPQLVGKAIPDFKDLKALISNVEPFRDMYNVEYNQALNAGAEADRVHERLSDLYGWNSGNECISIPQPKFYNVTRFKDLPCPYIDRETGRAFGWIVYKYCGSKSDNGHFKVNLSVRGRTKGKVGEEFMEFLHNLPQPTLTQPREVVVDNDPKNCWKCTRNLAAAGGEIEGRCYWDPSGGNDVVFVPVGLDENTFDWENTIKDDDGNVIGDNEMEQLKVWLGENIASYRERTATNYTTPTTTDPGNGLPPTDPEYIGPSGGAGATYTTPPFYTASIKRLSNGMPAEECWDTYVRRSQGDGNPDGVLDVYSAYYPQGSGNAQTQGRSPGYTFWEDPGENRQGVYNGFGTSMQGYFGGGACWYTLSYVYRIIYGGGSGSASPANEFALEYVNDLSIAIDPQLMNQLGIMMGPYSGTMGIKNWSTGATIAFGQTARNMGNPFFDECGGGIFDERNEVVQPNPPIPDRKVHNSSYDPGDKKLLQKQYKKGKFDKISDIQFEDDTWKKFYDEDFDYEETLDSKISDFSTDVDNLFNGAKNPEDF